MVRFLIAVLLLAAVTACAGADGGADDGAAPSSSPSPSAVEAVTPSPSPSSFPSPSPFASAAAGSEADATADVCGRAVEAAQAREDGAVQIAESGERLALMAVAAAPAIDEEVLQIYNDNSDQPQEAVSLIADWCEENGY
ncbi:MULTISPECIES: hypothetical protein [Nocardiopsis]|uniref:Lipoprotein n=1 Tax=Nocardiopsis dassonvillei (strain ATCC 23218 / DSM 43111 / CIP 107115 / JCM 7437 / KCTC 9190 / NBRC 14626 / NCTC 10488 / NRRL B-5397 / IMRU 509) TaxID=446468 RepID=D7B3X6_NOCDD|nr:hypothetical protein [Nocardiopsis dassonvillei]ADH66937.1 hypothetical protein Ndas_1507 [Nocardiopsis dassonvillei subsp. dassonvillei DSM 43111]NKY81648.1 hypothetical protein [Nocardiopsis dassonvillei]VEI86714.1 Uncharacterised protein [Nocardiopsis dassonvillei]